MKKRVKMKRSSVPQYMEEWIVRQTCRVSSERKGSAGLYAIGIADDCRNRRSRVTG